MQNNENVNDNENVVEEEFDVVKEVNDLKKNSVPKEEYDKVVEKNNQLLKSIINGDVEGLDLPEPDNSSNDNIEEIKKCRNDLANSELNNLDYIKTALKLRRAVIAEYGEEKDPFLPTGHDVVVTKEDIETANKVADIFQELVDEADGDSAYFTNNLQRAIVEDRRPIAKRK